MVGTFQPTNQIPINATRAIVVWPNPGSPNLVTVQIDNAETTDMIPIMTIFE